MGSWPVLCRLGAATIALVPPPLMASTASGTMAVSLTVEESCHLDARPMVFGALPSDRDPADAQSSLVVGCTAAASYVVSMDGGRYGSDGTRRMGDAAGTQFVAYDLYSDAARTRRWGETPANAVSAVAPASGRVELDIYARLAAGYAPAGVYSDTVTITVAF